MKYSNFFDSKLNVSIKVKNYIIFNGEKRTCRYRKYIIKFCSQQVQFSDRKKAKTKFKNISQEKIKKL